MKEHVLVIERVKEALKSIKAEVVSCLICDTQFVHKKNLYHHLKKPCKPVFTSVKQMTGETPDRTSLIRTYLSDLEDLGEPNPWVDEEEALKPEPEKGTCYTPRTRVHDRVRVYQLESRYYPPRRGCKAVV